MRVSHEELISLLRKMRAIPGVKKVFIRSGIRYDYLMADKSDAFLTELCRYHISGQLKVAPEHISPNVLSRMGKPRREVYEAFVDRYNAVNRKYGLNQYLVPYLMSSHPGSTLRDAVELAEYLRDTGHQPEQVQDFYPTPGTLSTCMYYTGLVPRDMQPVYVPKSPHEKAMQRALLQYRNPANHDLVREALRLCGRDDLIGFGPHALVPPRTIRASADGRSRQKAAHEEKGVRAQRSVSARSNVPTARRAERTGRQTDRAVSRRDSRASRRGGGRS